MQAIISNLTAAVLFIHTALGCCWHHADCAAPDVACAPASAARCCAHCDHDPGNRPGDIPGTCEVQCAGSCQYIAPHKLQIDAPHSVASLDCLANGQFLLVGIFAAVLHAGPCDFLCGAAPPLRTHLLYQVLLI